MCSTARIAAAFLPSKGPAAGTVWQGKKYSQIFTKQPDSGWLDYAVLLMLKIHYLLQSVSEWNGMVEQIILYILFSSPPPPYKVVSLNTSIQILETWEVRPGGQSL